MTVIKFPGVDVTLETSAEPQQIPQRGDYTIEIRASCKKLRGRFEGDGLRLDPVSKGPNSVGALRLKRDSSHSSQGVYIAADGALSLRMDLQPGDPLDTLLGKILVEPLGGQELEGWLLPDWLLISVPFQHLFALPSSTWVGILLRRNEKSWEWCVPQTLPALESEPGLSRLEGALQAAFGEMIAPECLQLPRDGAGWTLAEVEGPNPPGANVWQSVEGSLVLPLRNAVLRYPLEGQPPIELQTNWLRRTVVPGKKCLLELVEETPPREDKGKLSLCFRLPVLGEQDRRPRLAEDSEVSLPLWPMREKGTTAAQDTGLWFRLEDGWLHVTPNGSAGEAPPVHAWPRPAIAYESRSVAFTRWLPGREAAEAPERAADEDPGFRCSLLLDNSGSKRLRLWLTQAVGPAEGTEESRWRNDRRELRVDTPAVQLTTGKHIIWSEQLTVEYLPPLEIDPKPCAEPLVLYAPQLAALPHGHSPPFSAYLCLQSKEPPQLRLCAGVATWWCRPALLPLSTPLDWARNDPSAERGVSPLRGLVPIQLPAAAAGSEPRPYDWTLEPADKPFRLGRVALAQARWAPLAAGAVLRGCDVRAQAARDAPIETSLLGVEVELPADTPSAQAEAQLRLRYAVSVLDEHYSAEDVLPKGQSHAGASSAVRLRRSQVRGRFVPDSGPFAEDAFPLALSDVLTTPLHNTALWTESFFERRQIGPAHKQAQLTRDSQLWTCTVKLAGREFARLFTERGAQRNLADLDRLSILPPAQGGSGGPGLQIAGIKLHALAVRIAGADGGRLRASIDLAMETSSTPKTSEAGAAPDDQLTLDFELDSNLHASGTAETSAQPSALILSASTLAQLLTGKKPNSSAGSYRLVSVHAARVSLDADTQILVATELTLTYKHGELLLEAPSEDLLRLGSKDGLLTCELVMGQGKAGLRLTEDTLCAYVATEEIPGLCIELSYPFPGAYELCCAVRPGRAAPLGNVSVLAAGDRIYLAWAQQPASRTAAEPDPPRPRLLKYFGVETLTRLYLELQIDTRERQPRFASRRGIVGWQSVDVFGVFSPQSHLSLILGTSGSYLELNGLWKWEAHTEARSLSIELLGWDTRLEVLWDPGQNAYVLPPRLQRRLLASYLLRPGFPAPLDDIRWMVPQVVTFDFAGARMELASFLCLFAPDDVPAPAAGSGPPAERQELRRPGVSVTFARSDRRPDSHSACFLSLRASRTSDRTQCVLDVSRGFVPIDYTLLGSEILQQTGQEAEQPKATTTIETADEALCCPNLEVLKSILLKSPKQRLTALAWESAGDDEKGRWSGTSAVDVGRSGLFDASNEACLWLLPNGVQERRNAGLHRIPIPDSGKLEPLPLERLAGEILVYARWYGMAVLESRKEGPTVQWSLLDSPLLRRSEALTWASQEATRPPAGSREVRPTDFAGVPAPSAMEAMADLSIARVAAIEKRVDGSWTPPFVQLLICAPSGPLEPASGHEEILLRREIPFSLYGAREEDARLAGLRDLPWFGLRAPEDAKDPAFPVEYVLFKLAAPRPGELTHYQVGLVRQIKATNTLQVSPMAGLSLRTPRSPDEQLSVRVVEPQAAKSTHAAMLDCEIRFLREHPERYVLSDEKPVALGFMGPGPIFIGKGVTLSGSLVLDGVRCKRLVSDGSRPRLKISIDKTPKLLQLRRRGGDESKWDSSLILEPPADGILTVPIELRVDPESTLQAISGGPCSLVVQRVDAASASDKDLNAAPSQPILVVEEDILPPALPELIGIVRSVDGVRVLAGFGADPAPWQLLPTRPGTPDPVAGTASTVVTWQKAGSFVDRVPTMRRPAAYTILSISPDGSCAIGKPVLP